MACVCSVYVDNEWYFGEGFGWSVHQTVLIYIEHLMSRKYEFVYQLTI